MEEIRIRALENILSKLRNGIIFSEDLIHHRELIINLLQWFNHENPPKIREVLGLLANLAKVLKLIYEVLSEPFEIILFLHSFGSFFIIILEAFLLCRWSMFSFLD